MKNTKKILFLIIIILFSSYSFAEESFYNKAKEKFDQKKLEDSKFLFQRNIVFNPKHAKSYLYLAKIFNLRENDQEQEHSLNNVLLLNPKNDEALYMLTLLKIKQSDYEKANELIDKFNLVCKNFCSKDKEMREMLKKSDSDNE